ncbi:hypothetical protein V1280_008738 [Bradyrhizobium sp. AZCC 2230]
MTVYARQISKIPLQGDRVRARFSNRFRRHFGCIQIDVSHGNPYALGRKCSANCATEAAPAAENEGSFVLQL